MTFNKSDPIFSNYVLTYQDLMSLNYFPYDIDWHQFGLYGYLSNIDSECGIQTILKTDIQSFMDHGFFIYRFFTSNHLLITTIGDLEFPFVLLSDLNDIVMLGNMLCIERFLSS